MLDKFRFAFRWKFNGASMRSLDFGRHRRHTHSDVFEMESARFVADYGVHGVTVTETEEPTRRDFIYIATGAMGAVAVGGIAWPLIDQMNPDASTLALASIEVDVSGVETGQAITVMWRGKPVFIRNRTEQELEEAIAVPLDELRDPQTDAERTKPGHENLLVQVGICTHLGCVPLGQRPTDQRGAYGGYFCPCHGSHYDTSGRIRRGPAPRNLEVPEEITFTTETSIRLG